MKNKLLVAVMVILVFSLATISMAVSPGLPDGYPGYPGGYPDGYPGYPDGYPDGYPGYPDGYPDGYPGYPDGYPDGYPGYPDGYPDGYPGYPDGTGPIGPSDQIGTGDGHPAQGPVSSQPYSAPSASSGEALTQLAEGQMLSKQQVMAYGGGSQLMAYSMVGGLELWVWYNGYWSPGPAAVFYYGRTNMLTYNDLAQNIWSWEGYPSGYQQWKWWGYRMPGYINGWFWGDTRGWHQLAMWGSGSGWSNVVWIYVW